MALAIWMFCRAYSFAFCALEHCADPGHSGLVPFVRYVGRRERAR